MARKRLIGLGLSSLLWIAGFPFALYTPNLVPGILSAVVAWIFLVPILLSLEGCTPKEHFKWGYFLGLISNGGVFFWIIVAMHKYGGISYWGSSLILLAMISELALYPAVTFWSMARLQSRAPRWLIGALVFTLTEWTRVYFPLEGYPWGTPAYALHHSLPLLQVGDLVGICGLNFLILLGNFVFVEAIQARKPLKSFPRLGASLFLTCFIFTLGYGIVQISARKKSLEEKGSVDISLIQGNIPQETKVKRLRPIEVLEKYRKMSMEATSSSPDLIVWPEASLPMAISAETKEFPFLKGITDHATFVVGSPTWESKSGKERYLNSAFVVSPDGKVSLRYDKQHLVPFGEYVPFSSVLPMNKIVPPIAGNFAEAAPFLNLPSVGERQFGILICYEVLFPDLSIDMVRKGAQYLVNITNDAWFDQTSGPFIHANFGTFRAIETRRYIVRAANTGISTWFDPLGNSHEKTELFQDAILNVAIQPRSELTWYVRHPHLFPTLLTFLLLSASIGIFRRLA